jgi:hypothetical protein
MRKLSFEQASETIEQWLGICKTKRDLDFNSTQLISSALTTAKKSGYRPMSLSKLKEKNSTVYRMLVS